MNSRRVYILLPVLVALVIGLGPQRHALGQETAQEKPALRGGGKIEHRFPLKGLPDLVLPAMDPVRGRKYFASRTCVVCHSVNGVGGTSAAALDLENHPPTLDLLGFVTRMIRHGRPMAALQRRLFGEQIDLTSEEIGAIIAFLHSPSEQKRFTKDEIPLVIRNLIAGAQGGKTR